MSNISAKPSPTNWWLDPSIEGVVIIGLEDDAPAVGVGFRKGDVILNVNNKRMLTTGDLERIAREPSRLWRITVLREGNRFP
ncbi:MAG: PDZ domain-containing protein [Xanthobacteraceae bacterium]